MPWVEANFDRFRSELKGDQFKLYIAVDGATAFQSEFGPDVRDLIPAGFGIQEAGFVESGVPGRLVIYCELSGIPLDVMTPLRADWRRSYDKESSKPDSIPLHNHYDWMRFHSPIVPTTEEIERLRSDLNLFIRAVSFGVLKRKVSSKPFEPYLLEIRPRDFEQVGSERTIRKKLFDPMQRRTIEDRTIRIEEGLSPIQLLAASALFQYIAERAYPKRREIIGPQQDMRVAGLIHKVVRDLEADFEQRCRASGSVAIDGLQLAELKVNLYNSIAGWTVVVPDSVKDVDPLEGNQDPNDLPEYRAQDKRAIRADQFNDDQLFVFAGVQKLAPGPVSVLPADSIAGQFFWYVGADGKPSQRVVDSGAIVKLIHDDVIGPTTKLCAKGTKAWKPAAEWPMFSDFFEAAPPLDDEGPPPLS